LIGPSEVQPKSNEFWELSMLWSRVVDLQEVGDAPERWKSLETKVIPKLNELQSRVAPLAAGTGEEAILAQRMLKMIDVPDGPTKTEGLLRRIVTSGDKAKNADVVQVVQVMTEAAALVHGV
jgi:hypothetical protein